MIICKEINDYLSYYEACKHEFNKDRILLIENIVKPILKRNDVFFDEETFRKCLIYCEKHYYPLFPYQKFIYAFVFMYVDDQPLFPTLVVLMGRGNGKDGLMMPLANFLQTPLYGVKNYNIDIVANSEDQAKDSFNVVYDRIHDNPRFKGKFIATKQSIVNLKTNSRLRYNTSNAATKDGKVGGLVLFNEYHAYETYDQINVFTSQQGKIKHFRTVIITTNGYTRGGPLDDLLKLCRDILQTGENELGYFPFLCCLNDASEVDDESKWIYANPSMPYMPILKNKIKLEYLEMQRLPSKRPEFMTKRMNLPDEKEECALTSWENIERCCYVDVAKTIERPAPDLKDKPVVIGIDYADIRDFASAGVLGKVDGEYVWRQKTWICRNGKFFHDIKFPFKNYGQPGFQDFVITDGTSLPIDEIVAWCIDRMSEYNVQKVIMDTYRFSLFREEFGKYELIEESKQNPYGMLRMIRRSNAIYILNAPKIEKAFEDGMINYGNSSIMRWYTRNTGTVQDKMGNTSFIKIEPKLRKNDGFMAFVMAISGDDLLVEYDDQIYW